jgi:xanthosine phosphorylase
MTLLEQALAHVRQQTPLIPQIGMVFGSGLGDILQDMVDAIEIPYADIPGMDICTVAGHQGSLSIGYYQGVPVACLKGRPHRYEGCAPSAFRLPIRLLKMLGCTTVLMLNTAGSLNPQIRPGALVLVNDHINFQGNNPLVGPNDDDIGPRFVNMDCVYDKTLRQQLLASAEHIDLTLETGVYISVTGPSFETPAEIRAFRLWGADVVGMSTIPEVIVARHCHLRVALISVVSNMASGLSDQPLTHELTLQGVQLSLSRLTQLLNTWFTRWRLALPTDE